MYIYIFETLLRYTVLVLPVDPPISAAMVNGEFVVGACAEKLGRDGNLISLTRACVDCGLLTGNWCEASCFEVDRLGAKLEDWQDNQFTPHCTLCEKRYKFCHFCLGKDWATPEIHRIVNKTRVPLEDTDLYHKDDGVIYDLPYSELLAQSDTLPTRVIRHPSSPTRLSRE